MFPYVVLLVVLGIGMLSEVVNLTQRTKAIVSVFVVAFCVFFCGFRYYTGSDWAMYMEAYEMMPTIGNFHRWEMGFVWLSLFFHWTGVDYHFMQAAVSCFVMVVVYCTARRYTSMPMMVFSAFVVLLFNEIVMAQVRQSIALGILVYGVRFVVERRLVLWCLAVALASQFHISAVVAFPIFFLTIGVRRRVLLSIMAVAMIVTMFPELITNGIKVLLPILPKRLEFIATEYLKSSFFSGKTISNTGLLFVGKFLLTVVVVLVGLWKRTGKEENRSLWINCLVVASVVGTLAQSFMVLSRLESYYLAIGLMSLPTLTQIKVRRVKDNVVLFVVTLLLFCYFATPVLRTVTDKTRNELTRRERRYGLVPYNNYFIHSADAETKKDWDQK